MIRLPKFLETSFHGELTHAQGTISLPGRRGCSQTPIPRRPDYTACMFPRVSYGAPEANNREGMLVYRFDFGGVAESIHMRVESTCWDFFHELGGVGRGSSAIEVARDGDHWVALEDNIKAGRWGASITGDKDLPDEVCGSDTLRARVRCITESAPVEDGYNVAQFARTRFGNAEAALEVTARPGSGATDLRSQ